MPVKAALITLQASLWFIPTLMVGGAILLAYSCLTIDNGSLVEFDRYYGQPFAGGADSIRMMLSAIATSMITVSGITFSLTISSLAQMSGQLTARVLRNFMNQMTSKLVLGFFVGLFIYCLLVMRTIRTKDDAAGSFIPALSVSMGMILAIMGIGIMIYFIHYVALSVQASTVVSTVAREALATVDKLYPSTLSAADGDETRMLSNQVAAKVPQSIVATGYGYVQLIDEKKLIQFAQDNQLIIRVNAGTGDFVTQQSPLVTLYNGNRPVDQQAIKIINSAFTLRQTRAIDEELAFGIRQLVDISLKALAPSSDDTTTAVLVIDYLSAVLSQLVQRQLQVLPATDKFIPKHPSFANLLAGALDQIRDTSGGNTVVLTRLLLLIQVVGRSAPTHDRRTALIMHARLIAQQAHATLHQDYQRGLVHQQLVETLLALGQQAAAFPELLQPSSS